MNYDKWGDTHSDTFEEPVHPFPTLQKLSENANKSSLATAAVITYRAAVEKQCKMDSFMEAVTNIAVGFVISFLVWVFIVAPLFNLPNNASTSFWITCIFTVTSLIRQYVLRRLFNGRTIWETIRAKVA